MTDAPGPIPWEQIEEEAATRDEWVRHLRRFEEAIPRAVGGAGAADVASSKVRGPERAGSGRTLLRRLTEENRGRYETILFFERQWGSRDDYVFLIGPACWVLESELDRRIAVPARALVNDLIAALRRAGDDGPAGSLEKWAGTGITTMGVECLLLFALRRGHDQGVPSVLDFLGKHFEPPYARLLEDRRFGNCLAAIRDQYRNKACHGAGRFDRGRYEEFTRLMVANRRFLDWDGEGPVPYPPGAGVGLFHHHLAHARGVEE